MPEPASPPDAGAQAGSGPDPASRGGPMLALLARGLELWLRQQCEAIENLEIRLEGSAAALLRGRLQGVQLSARRVVFQHLEIEALELRSAPLQVRMGALWRSQQLHFDHPFRIDGWVQFSADGLNRTLATPAWRPLGDALAEEVLGRPPLGQLRFEGERLILASLGSAANLPIEVQARVEASGGTVQLGLEAQGRIVRLPMDANVQIERAELRGGRLELAGQALVSA